MMVNHCRWPPLSSILLYVRKLNIRPMLHSTNGIKCSDIPSNPQEQIRSSRYQFGLSRLSPLISYTRI